jgi:hypothetical protein
VIYSKPGALLHEDHARAPDEARGGGGANWPAFLEAIQGIVDGSRSFRLNQGVFGLEEEELPEYVIS